MKALEANGRGHLYSIDLPGHDKAIYPTIGRLYHIHVPQGWQPGWLVPSELKDRWTLIIGDAKLELPSLLANLESIDFFFHDSLHTYEHMMFEYCLAYSFLRDGPLLMSDNVIPIWSLAFIEFCDALRLRFARRRPVGHCQGSQAQKIVHWSSANCNPEWIFRALAGVYPGLYNHF